MIVLGGDGTILDTMIYMYQKPIPVLGYQYRPPWVFGR